MNAKRVVKVEPKPEVETQSVVEQQAVVEPMNGLYTSGAVIPTLADATYKEKTTPVTPPA